MLRALVGTTTTLAGSMKMRRLSLTTLNHQNNSQGTMKRSLKSILTIALQPGSEQQVGLVQRPELLQETLHGPRFI